LIGGARRGASGEDGTTCDVVGAGLEVEFVGGVEIGVTNLDAVAGRLVVVGGDFAGNLGVDLKSGRARAWVGLGTGSGHVVGARDAGARKGIPSGALACGPGSG